MLTLTAADCRFIVTLAGQNCRFTLTRDKVDRLGLECREVDQGAWPDAAVSA
jgi:hypothetical protein